MTTTWEDRQTEPTLTLACAQSSSPTCIWARGRRYNVIHGDEFDVIVRTAPWLAFLGDYGYEFALWLNHPLNWCRRHFGLGYWSLSAYLKYPVKRAVAYVGAFEEAVATETKQRGLGGEICGHIHHACDRTFGGIHYLSWGDWVESCTAVVETMDGDLRLVHWPECTLSRIVEGERGLTPQTVRPSLHSSLARSPKTG